MIDTGAPTSLIPHKIWKNTNHEILATHDIAGLNPNEECKLSVNVGRINIVILDEKKATNGRRVFAFLGMRDDLPLVLGFKNLLSEFKICFNYQKREAYLEEI